MSTKIKPDEFSETVLTLLRCVNYASDTELPEATRSRENSRKKYFIKTLKRRLEYLAARIYDRLDCPLSEENAERLKVSLASDYDFKEMLALYYLLSRFSLMEDFLLELSQGAIPGNWSEALKPFGLRASEDDKNIDAVDLLNTLL